MTLKQLGRRFHSIVWTHEGDVTDGDIKKLRDLLRTFANRADDETLVHLDQYLSDYW